jgi:enamine deaminase RidA (YjgF/YER057c/UK114 family)
LANPDYLVEAEVTAIASDNSSKVHEPSAEHARHNPIGMYPPARNSYSQVVITRQPKQFHVGSISGVDGDVASTQSMGQQAKQLAANFLTAIHEVGATLSDVARITVYVKDVASFRVEGLREVYGLFDHSKPASTLVGVTELSDPRAMVEMSALLVSRGPEGRQI